MTSRNGRLWLIASMIVAAALLRFAPHVPNMTPVGALALFAGAHVSRKWLAFLIPLAAMGLSDLVLEITTGWGFHSTIGWVYGAFGLIVVLGIVVRRLGISFGSVTLGALGASTVFFVVSNFGVWASTTLYPKTLAGLATCFTAAIPFYWNTLAADLIWTAVLFGAMAMAERTVPALREPLDA